MTEDIKEIKRRLTKGGFLYEKKRIMKNYIQLVSRDYYVCVLI